MLRMSKTSSLSARSDRLHERVIECHQQAGFGATLALTMFAFGALALALIADEAAVTYADSVEKELQRSQSGLNATACADSIDLVRSKDVFAAGDIDIPELGCHVHL